MGILDWLSGSNDKGSEWGQAATPEEILVRKLRNGRISKREYNRKLQDLRRKQRGGGFWG